MYGGRENRGFRKNQADDTTGTVLYLAHAMGIVRTFTSRHVFQTHDLNNDTEFY